MRHAHLRTSKLKMPLITITGYPCCGKSHRATQLASYLKDRITATPNSKLTVELISDDTLNLSRDVYGDVRVREKDARAALLSAVKRSLSTTAIIILDSGNYIKGYRYQLFCEAKALRTPSCVLHVGAREDVCRSRNEARISSTDEKAYEEAVFDNLIARYEEPNGMARWDAPLFIVVDEDENVPGEQIWNALEGTVVKSHAATVITPAKEGNYLHELDRGTTEIVSRIQEWQKDHPEGGGSVSIEGIDDAVELPMGLVSVGTLQRIRRQFVSLNRVHSLEKSRVRALFVDYLNDSFHGS
ncbi:chromatin associated protein KTI12 [Microthyrium microscopicum]|uniref:Chromatin associated protein KTI12 n=1 Tax=Microthyrium microscopicum TaxID=703497 RepID=A0A6A6UGP4_9PEZI|nr:chromatin associated protein KTI12 [Microthyrium microscopicum]